MGVKYTRDYKDIIKEMAAGIIDIVNVYEFFEMTSEDWNSMDESERKECVRTLADDIFYALGNEETITVGEGSVSYDKSLNEIRIYNDDFCLKKIHLMTKQM